MLLVQSCQESAWNNCQICIILVGIYIRFNARDRVKAEIIKGFNEEQQQEMLEAVKQLRTYTYKFSEIYFNANKYCYGRCGTMASLFPIADEGIMMRDLLAKLLFLNWHKGGY